MFDAILFDMDGTLIDSEPVWVECVRACFAEQGILLTPELEARCVGLSNAAGIQLVLDVYPDRPVDPTKMAQAITTAVAQRLRQQSCAMPGADTLLRTLYRHQIPLALVSSSPRCLIDSVLTAQRWDRLFQQVLSVEEVGPGKPDPAVYREALRRLKVTAANALAVEDTLTGAQAAQRAGITVAVIPSYPHEQAALKKMADFMFSTLALAATWILLNARQLN